VNSSPQINRVSRWCTFGTFILFAFAVAWAQKGTSPSPGKQLGREGVTDHGNKVHIYLSVNAEKEYRAQHPTQDSLGPLGACAAPCNLIYNTGPVMRNPTNYLIFWQPPGRAAFPAGYQAAIEKFFRDEGGTPFYNIVTEYSDSSGIAVPNAESLGAPSFTDTTTAPPSGNDGTIAHPLTDSDVQNEVDVALAANPTWLGPATDVEYFVFTPSDVDECTDSTDCFAINGGSNGTFCAYHGDHGAGEYAYQPFAGNGNCTTQATFPNGQNVDTVLSATSHEEIESNTDPQLSAWRSADGNEIGDKCAYNYGYTAPDGTNFVLNGDRYQIQQEWSNDVAGCAKRYGPTPTTSVPGSLDFGEVEAGNTAEKDVVIQNSGGGDLNILNIRLGAGSDPDYSLLNVPPTAATLHSSESLTVQVKFAPPANALFGHPAASVVVDTDDPAQTTYTTNVTGTVGVPPLARCTSRTVPTDFNLCTTANVSINNGSYDPDGENITLIQSPAGPYSLGTTGVTLTVTDTDQQSASCTANVTVQDLQPPSITCPAPQSIQCTGSSGAAATLNPTFSDNCPGVKASCVPPSGSTFGFGTTTYTCTATDGSNNTSSCNSSVTVTDVPPVISSVVASPSILRPPNKKLDPVSILVKDTDTCDPSPVCTISSVTASNHAVVAGVDYVITGPLTLLLKANGNGGHPFSYIIGVTCADSHGGSTSAQTTVSVPSF
jgi:hypothetical protein